MSKMVKTVLLLGSNIEPRLTFLNQALSLLEEETGKAVAISEVYESEPWGFEAKTPFYNQSVMFETDKPAGEILNICMKTETVLGRKRGNTEGYVSRTIDVDILYFGNKVINTKNLVIPHPRLHLRRFALMPLTEIASGMIHPLLNKTQKELLSECPDRSEVKLVNQ